MEKIVCEGGFLWRRVLERLECRVNAVLAAGYEITAVNVHFGLLGRVAYMVTMRKV